MLFRLLRKRSPPGRTQGEVSFFYQRACHSAGTTLLQMQIVINNIINNFWHLIKKYAFT